MSLRSGHLFELGTKAKMQCDDDNPVDFAGEMQGAFPHQTIAARAGSKSAMAIGTSDWYLNIKEQRSSEAICQEEAVRDSQTCPSI